MIYTGESMTFLPTNLDEGKKYYPDFSVFDIIFITGDPYYDHPLSGVAILSRLLDKKGYKVGIIAQPLDNYDYLKCGRPKYFFCVTSGMQDSIMANYTPMLREREDVLVPERALIVYTQKIKELYKDAIVVLGGVEATIRRFTHFDYKENKLRRGIINDTKAEILLFGNAERSLLQLAGKFKVLESGQTGFEKIKTQLNLTEIDGAAFRVKKAEIDPGLRVLPSYEECLADKSNFNLLTTIHYLLPDDAFIEPCGLGFIQHNRPAHTLSEKEMDLIYDLPFSRKLHHDTKNLELTEMMVKKLQNSVIIGRGCWGSCSFCVIPLVQGKEVARRSKENIVKEIDSLYSRGVSTINDLTLPTLNMYGSHCSLYNISKTIFSPIIEEEITVYDKKEYCNQQCVGCDKRVLRDDLLPLLQEIEKSQQQYPHASLELRSAIRHDIILQQKELFRKIMQFVTRLKIAPEHVSDLVLKQMNKGTRKEFVEFLKEYILINKEQSTHKNLVPYFIAAHPGCTEEEMYELKDFCEEHDLFVNLTQVFTPTPGTLSTTAYYSGENPITKEKIYVPRTFVEKKKQKSIILGSFDSSEDELKDDDESL